MIIYFWMQGTFWEGSFKANSEIWWLGWGGHAWNTGAGKNSEAPREELTVRQAEPSRISRLWSFMEKAWKKGVSEAGSNSELSWYQLQYHIWEVLAKLSVNQKTYFSHTQFCSTTGACVEVWVTMGIVIHAASHRAPGWSSVSKTIITDCNFIFSFSFLKIGL